MYTIKRAFNELKLTPGFSLTVVSTLGLSVGALLWVITLAYLLLIKPLPYPNQERLFVVNHMLFDDQGVNNLTAFTYPSLTHAYANQTVFEKLALVNVEDNFITSLESQPRLKTSYVTPEWFSITGSEFEIGRGFTIDEGFNKHNPVAILSYSLWKEQFNFDRNILNNTVTINGVNFSIIGVLKESFIEPKVLGSMRENQIWLPWDYNSHRTLEKSWGHIRPSLHLVGLLDKGVSKAQAEQSLTNLINDTWKENVVDIQFFSGWHVETQLANFNKVIFGNNEVTVYLLILGGVGLLVIASTNIANIFMARVIKKQKTLAIQASVGAKRYHLYLYFFAESFILLSLSTALALGIAHFGIIIAQDLMGTAIPRIDELALDSVSLVCAIVVMFGLSIIFSLVGCNSINYGLLSKSIKSSGKGLGAQVSKRLRNILVSIQVTVALLIVFISLVLMHSSLSIINEPLGYNSSNLYQFNVMPPESGNSNDVKVSEALNLKNKLLYSPSIEAVTQSWSPVMRSRNAGFTTMDGKHNFSNENRYVDENYFNVIEQKLLRGRGFTSDDVKAKNKVLVINDTFAQRLKQGGDVIGYKLLNPAGVPFTVIGVVESIKLPAEEAPMRTYRPSLPSSTSFLVKVKQNQRISRSEVVSLLNRENSQWRVYNFENLNELKNKRLFVPIATTYITCLLSLLTVFISGVGLYGVLSYSVKVRQFEIGTRLAIGAKRKSIIWMILSNNLMPVLFGLLVSLSTIVAIYYGSNFAVNQYFTIDVLTIFVLSLFVVLMIVGVACYLPLRKFINNPPLMSLKIID